mmetsp:Transcript_11914/g.25555  ORF Transcript_11914/g.25555 Transcript_11914/m.25555 type:complete len:210 (+) Transcript_11914:274-903(+)
MAQHRLAQNGQRHSSPSTQHSLESSCVLSDLLYTRWLRLPRGACRALLSRNHHAPSCSKSRRRGGERRMGEGWGRGIIERDEQREEERGGEEGVKTERRKRHGEEKKAREEAPLPRKRDNRTEGYEADQRRKGDSCERCRETWDGRREGVRRLNARFRSVQARRPVVVKEFARTSIDPRHQVFVAVYARGQATFSDQILASSTSVMAKT